MSNRTESRGGHRPAPALPDSSHPTGVGHGPAASTFVVREAFKPLDCSFCGVTVASIRMNGFLACATCAQQRLGVYR